MLHHCVFCHIRPDADPAELRAVMDKLGALRSEVDGMLDFHHGPNRDFENKSPHHGYGFVMVFRDRAAHRTYDSHPEHKAAGARLVALCQGGYDGIMVYDLEVGFMDA